MKIQLTMVNVMFFLVLISFAFLSFFVCTLRNTTDTVISVNRKISRNSSSRIYVVGAYHISDSLLRVILISHCNLKWEVSASFDGITFITGKLSIINYSCPGIIHRPCFYDGFYAEFTVPQYFDGSQVKLKSKVTGYDDEVVIIPIMKSYSLTERKHFLAVCVKPLFYFNDWIQLVQFVEYYNVTGATKFFIYWQSISPTVKQAVDNYVAAGLDIEFVDWPRLSDYDADSKMLQSGQIVTINDCLHRARSVAEFVAVVDFDELITTTSGSLLDLLHKAKDQKLLTGYSFASLRVNSATFQHSSTDSRTLSFMPLSSIDVDQLKTEWSKKVIVRPELVRSGSIHRIDKYEPNALETIMPSTSVAFNAHARIAKDFRTGSGNVKKYTGMKTAAEEMTRNWQKRAREWQSKFKGSFEILPDRAKFNNKMEACTKQVWSVISLLCNTGTLCHYVVERYAYEWLSPEKKWIEI